MGRLPTLDRDEVEPKVQVIYDKYLEERGNVPNAFQTLAALPDHLSTLIDHYRQVMFEGEIPFKFKELLFLHVCRINASHY